MVVAVKVGHSLRQAQDRLQTPYKQRTQPSAGFFVCIKFNVDPVSSTGQALLERSAKACATDVARAL